MTLPIRECRMCGGSFQSRRIEQDCCSVACRRNTPEQKAYHKSYEADYYQANKVPPDLPDRACIICGTVFSPKKRVHVACSKPCRYQASLPALRERRLMVGYGITTDEYDAMLVAQSGLCAICRRSSDLTLHVDHCHKTGRVRQLLCQRCNPALGLFDDDPELLIAAALYLERWAS